MKLIAILIFLSIGGYAYCQPYVKPDSVKLQELLDRKQTCNLFGQIKVKYSGKVNFGRDAYYGYSYFLTDDFHEVIQKKYTDTEKYVSSDKQCLIKFWPGLKVYSPIGKVDKKGHWIAWKSEDVINVENAVDRYIKRIKNGNVAELGKLNITGFCKGIDGYNFEISLMGHDNKYGYVYKIIISELAIDGDLMFKHFLYKYKLSGKIKYEPLGMVMANYYSNVYDNHKLNLIK